MRHGAVNQLPLVPKTEEMVVVRRIAAEEVVAPRVTHQHRDSTASNRLHVLRQCAPFAPPVIEVTVENSGLVFGKRPSPSAGPGQHSADIPEISVTVATGDIGND